MLFNYLKIALRNIIKYKTVSFISIFGLALGIASFLFIYSFVAYENSYDDFQVNGNRIYRIDKTITEKDNTYDRCLTGIPLANYLREYSSEIEEVIRFTSFFNMAHVRVNNKIYSEKNFLYADGNIFKVFSFRLAEGNESTALMEPNSVVITKEVAIKYFGNENPLGKTIVYEFDERKSEEFLVTGVFDEIPANTHISFDLLASFSTLHTMFGPDYMNNRWEGAPTWTYLMLHKNADIKNLELELKNLGDKIGFNNDEKRIEYNPVPLKDLYYFKLNGIPIGDFGFKPITYILLIISFSILIIAGVNYSNLLTTKSVTRAKEIGIRKLIGAKQHSLIFQFLTESYLLLFISLMLALVLFEILAGAFSGFVSNIFPTFSILSQRKIELDSTILFNNFTTVATVLFIIGFVCGGYPAFILSRKKIVDVVKGEFFDGKSSGWFRKILVAGQFTATLIFLIVSFHLISLLQKYNNIDLGFNKTNVVVIPMDCNEVREKYNALKSEFLLSPQVKSVSASTFIPGGNSINYFSVSTDNAEVENMASTFVEEDFLKTMEIDMVQGGEDIKNIPGIKFYITESAAKDLGIEHLSNNHASLFNKVNEDRYDFASGRIAGIVKNVQYLGSNKESESLIITVGNEKKIMKFMLVNLSTEKFSENIKSLQTKWEQFNLPQQFSYKLLSEEVASNFIIFTSVGMLVNSTTLLILLISCLGLFALAAFTINMRAKEIAIRKVLGASAKQIVLILSATFIKCIALSILIALPISYILIKEVLKNLPNSISIDERLFVAAAMFLIFSAFITIAGKVIGESLRKPVENLKYE